MTKVLVSNVKYSVKLSIQPSLVPKKITIYCYVLLEKDIINL